MKPQIAFIFLMGLILAGCGGSSGSSTVGDVSGFVEDINGNPVRNAQVFVSGGPQTVSNSSGSYRLTNVTGDVRTIKATVSQDGVNYVGNNVVQLFQGETSKSTNITMVPANSTATLTGTVIDRNGDLVENAHVFAAAVNGSGTPTVFSSNMVLTDSNGNFTINDLMGGQNYSVIASAITFDSDTETVNIAAGHSQNLIFTLSNATDPLLNPPANVIGTAWTTPGEATHRITTQQKAGLEAIKQMIDPKRVASRGVHTRDTIGGNFVELDLEWDPMNDPALIGFNIYRAPGNVPTGSLVNTDFYRDPLATLYEDMDPTFQEGQTYSMAVTALNTNALNTANSESAFSNEVVVNTIGDMNLNAVTLTPVTFNWQLLVGASTYEVFVFDRYPAIGVSSLWSATTAGNSLAYGGPALTSGHTYYYVVLGSGNSGSSKSLSIIDSFVAP